MGHIMFMRKGNVHTIPKINIDISAVGISYTGDYTDQIVTMTEGEYRLLTLTSSGTLTIDTPIKGDVWLCGGGAKGNWRYGRGGGGGFVNQVSELDIPSTVSCIIGAGSTVDGGTGVNDYTSIGGESSFGSYTALGAQNKNGGSGGGAGGYSASTSRGTGAGISTYPFLDDTYFSGSPHCAGGGGGGYRDDEDQYKGGKGGTNGGNGSARSATTSTTDNGSGGTKGGGAGGRSSKSAGSSYEAGKDATFYGSGGGGGSYYDKNGSSNSGDGGNGYQGVIYIRIPLEQ